MVQAAVQDNGEVIGTPSGWHMACSVLTRPLRKDVTAGVTLSRETLDRLARITADAGSWLVIDETYEDFLFSGQTHYCPNAPNVVHVFSFSKVRLQPVL